MGNPSANGPLGKEMGSEGLLQFVNDAKEWRKKQLLKSISGLFMYYIPAMYNKHKKFGRLDSPLTYILLNYEALN